MSPEFVEMHNLKEIRKALIWGVPLLAGVSGSSFWMVGYDIFPTIDRLISGAAVVRITPGALLFPFVGVFGALGVVIGILRGIPYNGKIVKILENAFNAVVFASAIALVLIVTTATLIQNHYMPKLGYTRCDLLQGNPTLWFTDWVKNSDWCVKGRTREWVNEQARLAAQ